MIYIIVNCYTGAYLVPQKRMWFLIAGGFVEWIDGHNLWLSEYPIHVKNVGLGELVIDREAE